MAAAASRRARRDVTGGERDLGPQQRHLLPRVQDRRGVEQRIGMTRLRGAQVRAARERRGRVGRVALHRQQRKPRDCGRGRQGDENASTGRSAGHDRSMLTPTGRAALGACGA